LKRIQINWAIPGLLAMILIIAAIAWAQSRAAVSPDPAKLATQCSSCHQMGDHVETWQESSHKDVACTECHADPGVRGWVEMQLGKVRMYTHRTDANQAQIATEVPNSRCIECHARQMPWVMQDLKPAKLDEQGEPIRPAVKDLEFLGATAGHDVHLTKENPLNCIDCHKAVAHGPAPEKQLDRAATMHQVCLDCHAQEKVAVVVRNTVSCSACHLDMNKVAPDTHRSVTFRQEHGKAATADVTACQQCHLNPGINGQLAVSAHGLTTAVLSTGTPANAKTTSATMVASSAASSAAAQAAAGNLAPAVPKMPPGTIAVPQGLTDACSSCHGLTMPHPADWLGQHAQGFNEKPELCASCHGDREQGFTDTFKGDPRTLPTADAKCAGCHAQPMPHPENWFPTGHAEAAKLAPATCQQCHSPANQANPKSPHATATYCLDCHLSKFSHPSNYVSDHKQLLATYGNDQNAAGCTQCHTPATNSCTTCHQGGVEGLQEWHPSNWTVVHKDSMARYGNSQTAAGCTTCHPTNDPQNKTGLSCTACHEGGVKVGQQWHPADWVGTHRKSLARVGDDQVAAGCTTCHPTNDPANLTGLSCTACHKSGTDKPTQWHPANWWVTHARTTTADNAQSCNECHAYVQPSCSQCHATKF
jgi:hypothetical protein